MRGGGKGWQPDTCKARWPFTIRSDLLAKVNDLFCQVKPRPARRGSFAGEVMPTTASSDGFCLGTTGGESVKTGVAADKACNCPLW